MARIRLTGRPGHMACVLTDVPAFAGARFNFGYPEAIGDAAATRWFGSIHPSWEELDDGVWVTDGKLEGVLEYRLTLTPYDDRVEAHYRLTNLGEKAWNEALAFNCVQCGTPALRDHECVRHWVGRAGKLTRLVEVPRAFGPRPAIQLYSVEGAPPGKEIPFVANFRATPEDTVLAPWMAVVSRDGSRLVATVSKPALFLFQNREYSCIHSGCGFGPVAPGATAESRNCTYFVQSSLDAWHRRMTTEFLGSN